MPKKTFILATVFLLYMYGCRGREAWQTATLLYFDTVCEINLFCAPSDFDISKEKIRRVFEDIEKNFSPGAAFYSSPRVISLYKRALAVYRDSEGCFDITVAPLSRIWGFRDKTHRIPSPGEIEKTLEHIGMEKVILKNGKLHLSPGTELDWGGIAKGFGIDLAYQTLVHTGVRNGFINAGGDLYCWGKNPERQSWRIGVKNPRAEGVSAIIYLSGCGAATTGDYQRFFLQKGIRYHHVFDPKSGYPSEGKQSVTVIGPETQLCDALSTALFVSPQPENILKKFPEYGAVLIDSEGKIFTLGKEYPIRLEE